jgi:two-component system LytT family response regulator
MTTIQPNKISLTTLAGTYFFAADEIIRLEASRNYTNIYFTNKPKILASKVLKDFVDILEPFGFIRTHRSHLVNKQYIMFVEAGGNMVMQDKSKPEISRRKKSLVLKALKNYNS